MPIAWLLMAAMSLGVGPRLRPLDPMASDAIASGVARSPTFAALVQTVEDSEFVVYVESSRQLKGGMQGCLVHGRAGPRYLRVIMKMGLSVDERIEVLAHELQHVREVIEAGIINDSAAMKALFSRIGYNRRQQGRQQEYETEAARRMSTMVARDLASNRPR